MTGDGNGGLESRLRAQGHRFDFFAAVQLLHRLAVEHVDAPAARRALAERAPSPRTVRFRAQASLAFPAAAVESVADAAPAEGDRRAQPCAMTVAFAGLTGPGGVLPSHYTVHLLNTLRDKITTLRDFLDLFNHQAVAHFYQAWEKYRLPPAYARARLGGGPADLFTRVVASLAGLGTQGLEGRLAIGDEVILHYAGHFARRTRPAAALQAMLGEFLDVPVVIRQFQGRWLPLRDEDRTRLAARGGANRGLGRDALLGARVWDVESRFRIRLGPMCYRSFCRFMPVGEGLPALAELVRLFAGPEREFDVEAHLRRDEVPRTRLGGGDPVPGRLGWNTWIRSNEYPRETAFARFQIASV